MPLPLPFYRIKSWNTFPDRFLHLLLLKSFYPGRNCSPPQTPKVKGAFATWKKVTTNTNLQKSSPGRGPIWCFLRGGGRIRSYATDYAELVGRIFCFYRLSSLLVLVLVVEHSRQTPWCWDVTPTSSAADYGRRLLKQLREGASATSLSRLFHSGTVRGKLRMWGQL